jgi:YD repeat-containing protein
MPFTRRSGKNRTRSAGSRKRHYGKAHERPRRCGPDLAAGPWGMRHGERGVSNARPRSGTAGGREVESSGQGRARGSIIKTVEKQLTSGFLVSPSGELFLSPFFLLAAVLDPQKAHLGKNSERNKHVTGSAVVRPETALGCGEFGYDKALGSSAYAWVDEDRMASVTGPGVAVAYQYDADGRRVRETAGVAIKQYLIDRMLPYGQVVVEYSYGLERISQVRGGASHFYLADGQGSVRQLTDSIGAVSDTYLYSAFGETLASTGTTVNEFLYVGEQADPNSGFYYLRARWMDPASGRFPGR